METRIVKPGFRSGLLEVLEEAPRREGRKMWLCRCDCGGEKVVSDSHLKSGHTKSCGCITRSRMRNTAFDLTGRQFGRLTVISPASERINGSVTWHCVCDCGNELDVEAEYLLRDKTRSCGCLKEEQRKINMEKAIHFVDGTCIEKIACQREIATNTSGHRGVTRRSHGTWRAALTFRGKRYDLGTHKTFEQAVAARLSGERLHYGEYLEKYYAEQSKGSL